MDCENNTVGVSQVFKMATISCLVSETVTHDMAEKINHVNKGHVDHG